MRKVTERVVELSDKKELVTAEDLPYIIADVLRYDLAENPVRILNYSLSLAQGLHPAASLKIEINGCEYGVRTYTVCSVRICEVTGYKNLMRFHFTKQVTYDFHIRFTNWVLLNLTCFVEW